MISLMFNKGKRGEVQGGAPYLFLEIECIAKKVSKVFYYVNR